MRRAIAIAYLIGFLVPYGHAQDLIIYRQGNKYSAIEGRGKPVVIRENTLEIVRPAYTPPLGAIPGPIRPGNQAPALATPVAQPVPIVIQVTIRQAPVYHYTPPTQHFYRNRVR